MVLYPYLKLIQMVKENKYVHLGSLVNQSNSSYEWSSSPTLCWAQFQHWVQISSFSVLSTWVLIQQPHVNSCFNILFFLQLFFFHLYTYGQQLSFQFITTVSCHIHHWRIFGLWSEQPLLELEDFLLQRQNVGCSLKSFCACSFFSLVV